LAKINNIFNMIPAQAISTTTGTKSKNIILKYQYHIYTFVIHSWSNNYLA